MSSVIRASSVFFQFIPVSLPSPPRAMHLFTEDVYDKYTISSPISPFASVSFFSSSPYQPTRHSARSLPPRVTPFIHSTWHHPALLSAISHAAGLDLVPSLPCETGTVNIQLPSGTDREGCLATPHEPQPQPLMTEEEEREARAGAEKDGEEGEGSFTMFHYDSCPFVDTMIGGETAVKTGSGRILKVRGPSVGSCVVLQGRHIHHAALRAFGRGERCAMVTSFKARDPMVADGAVLPTLRIITRKNRLNYEWTDYRFKLLYERFAITAKQLEDKKKSFGPGDDVDGLGGRELVNIEEMTKFIDQQIAYLEMTKRVWMTKEFDEEQKDMMEEQARARDA
ncbi:hypothetical protein JCM8547_008326 [Rhodosporidiobolus lusitaniae]